MGDYLIVDGERYKAQEMDDTTCEGCAFAHDWSRCRTVDSGACVDPNVIWIKAE